MKDRLEQLEIEIASHKGSKIESTLRNRNEWLTNPNPLWNWNDYDYRIKVEPKRIPFDGSDAFNLIGRKFKFKEYESDFVIAIGVDEDGLYFHHDRVTYESLSDDFEIWNDLLKVFEPCNKVA